MGGREERRTEGGKEGGSDVGRERGRHRQTKIFRNLRLKQAL